MEKIMAFIRRHRDFWAYTFFGFLASLINIVSFMLIKQVFHTHYIFANTLAWLISVVFGFFTNKSLVFKSKYSTGYALMTELIAFFFFRGLSFVADSLLMVTFISIFRWSSFISKILDQVIVGVLNYITSRYTFSKDQKEMATRLRRLRLERQKNRRQRSQLTAPPKAKDNKHDN